MWLISGPFDGPRSDVVNYTKVKLLKPDTCYPLGRKGKSLKQLLVSHGKVSSENGKFIVGSHSIDDVSSPDVIPSLQLQNTKNKALLLTRAGVATTLNPDTNTQLKSGDSIMIAGDISVSVEWRLVCCYLQPRGNPAVSLDGCASLGVKVVQRPSPDVTHHLTQSLAITRPIVTSLLSAAQLVRQDWLTELIRVGSPTEDNPKGTSPLELTFSLPPESKFRPTFSPALPPALKTFKTWEPNEERLNMLRGFRFIFVGEKGREVDGDLRELVDRGGGEYEGFPVSSGKAQWHRILSKGKAKTEGKKGLVIVAEEDAMRAAVGDAWDGLVDEAKTFSLRFIRPDNILQAVAYVQTSHLDCTTTAEDASQEGPSASSLPDFVPNTHPDEPSIPPHGFRQSQSQTDQAIPGPSSRLRRRATSSPPSPKVTPALELEANPVVVPPPYPSIEADEPMVPPPPRRTLTRRARTNAADILGIDDLSINESQPSMRATPEVETPAPRTDLTGQTPGRSSRLKRRAGTAAPVSQLFAAIDATLTDQASEPPLKKFKALFDESDPDRDHPKNGLGTPEQRSVGSSQTQTQSLVERGRGTHVLLPVAEEEEESGGSIAVGHVQRGTKRKAVDAGSRDAEMEDTDGGPSGPGPVKRRAVEDLNAVESSQRTLSSDSTIRDSGTRPKSTLPNKPISIAKSPKKPGASPGKPDTDTEFLKALASTKKGKKTEDLFDREFNNLRISKPDLQREEQEKEWVVLEEFGDDRNVRGNFVVVVEMDVFRPEGKGRIPATDRMDWSSRPDFKKFKKKAPGYKTPTIELVAEEENDYGMGSGYWKGNSQLQSQSQGDFGQSQSQHLARTQTQHSRPPSRAAPARRAKSRGFAAADSEDEEVGAPPSKGKRKASRSQPQTQTQAARGKTQTPGDEREQPLFFESDEDDNGTGAISKDDVAAGEDADGDADPELTLRSTATSQRKGKARLASPGMQKSKTRAKKAPATIINDDSDDGATFQGFMGNKRAGKGR